MPNDKIDYGTEMPTLVEAASKDPEAWHRAMWGTMEGVGQMTTSRDDLLFLLIETLPLLERAATDETRRNKAPTGLPPITKARDLWNHVAEGIANA